MIIVLRVVGRKETARGVATALEAGGITVLHDDGKRRRAGDDADVLEFLSKDAEGKICVWVQRIGRDRVPHASIPHLDEAAALILRAEVLKVRQ